MIWPFLQEALAWTFWKKSQESCSQWNGDMGWNHGCSSGDPHSPL